MLVALAFLGSALALSGSALALPGSVAGARADWLELLPACALEAASEPVFAILYPRTALPAVVAAGATLVVRVRVPAGLTPPPGAQQPGVLEPWSAQLSASAQPALGATAKSIDYPLPVVDLRPDGASSLVYRLSLPIPAWTAPGSYDLRVRGPGGEQRLAASVYVRQGDAWPRLSVAAPTVDVAGPGPPVDGSGAETSAALLAPPQLELAPLQLGDEVASPNVATLAPDGVGYAILRYGAGLFEVGSDTSCARSNRGLRRGLERATGLPFQGRLGDGESDVVGVQEPMVPIPRVSIVATAARVRVTLAAAATNAVPRAVHLRLIVPVRADGYRVRGARRHAFFPVGEWYGRPPERLVLWVALSPGRVFELEPAGGPPGPPGVRASGPVAGLVGRGVRLGWQARSGARIALRSSARDTYYATQISDVVPREAGSQLLTAVVVGARGQVELFRGRLLARPARQGCSVGWGPAGGMREASGAGSLATWLATFLLALALLKRRADRRGGNKIARSCRCRS